MRAGTHGAALAVAVLSLLPLAVACTGPASPAAPASAAPPCAPGAVPVGATAAELQTALDDAEPGDVLQLAETTYAGRFVVTAAGTADAPITLCGTERSVLDGGSTSDGYVLHLDGAAHWVLDGFAVTRGAKGIMLDGVRFTTLQSLLVHRTGEEGIHLRSGSSDNVVRDSTIRDTGMHTAEFGEGIYVGSAESNWCRYTGCRPDDSDRNRITGNTVEGVTAEAIDIKEGTSGGIVDGNVLTTAEGAAVDSVVDVKGSDWTIRGNSVRADGRVAIQVHVILPPWGARNVFEANELVVEGTDGIGIELVGEARGSANRIACDNRISSGSALASVPCR